MVEASSRRKLKEIRHIKGKKRSIREKQIKFKRSSEKGKIIFGCSEQNELLAAQSRVSLHVFICILAVLGHKFHDSKWPAYIGTHILKLTA